MLQRSESGKPDKPTHVYGFLLGIELEEGTSLQEICNLLADAVKFHEGAGDITVDVLGEVEFVDENAPEISEWEQVDSKLAN